MTTALTHTNCKLNSLSLSRNDKCVEHLATALIKSNCKLNNLSLRTNRSRFGDIDPLTKNNWKLNSLNISPVHSNCVTQITYKGVKRLTKALTNKNCKLKSLSLPKGVVSKKSKINVCECFRQVFDTFIAYRAQAELKVIKLQEVFMSAVVKSFSVISVLVSSKLF